MNNQIDDEIDSELETNLDKKDSENKDRVKKIILEKLITLVQSSTR
jgi:hypothetical protein